MIAVPSARSSILLVALWVCALAAGCGPWSAAPPTGTSTAPADHGHEDHDHGDHEHAHPTTLAEGVAALAWTAGVVKDKLAAGAADEADDAVHDLGHLLEDLQGLVRKEEIPAEAKASATKAIDELFECFDKLDTALHAEPGAGDAPKDVHASIAERIEAAIGALRQAARAPAAAGDEAAASNGAAPATKED
jgi:hypothetical protein